MNTKVMRTSSLVIGAVIAAVGLTACAGPGSSASAAKPLNLALMNHSWTTQLQKFVSEFTAETGIVVNVNVYDDEPLAQLYNVKLNAGSSDIDVMMYRPLQDARLMTKNNWLADLSGYIKDNTKYDWNDFWQSSRDSLTVDGKIVGVPLASETGLLYYRKDLLAKAGLEVPKTMDELTHAVEVIHQQNPDIFAFAGRGEKSASVTQFSSFLYGFGGNWVDKDGNAAVDSPEAIKAYEYLGGLIRDYGPPGAADMNWPQVMGLLQQGLVAFYPEGSSNYTSAIDPKASKVADQIGVAPIPAGANGSHSYNITATALGMNQASTNKDNAWKFIEWATNKANALRIQAASVPGARTSVWNDPAGTSTLPADLLATIKYNAGDTVGVGNDRPLVLNVAQAREYVGTPLVTAITGGDVAAAAKQANIDFQALLDKESK